MILTDHVVSVLYVIIEGDVAIVIKRVRQQAGAVVDPQLPAPLVDVVVAGEHEIHHADGYAVLGGYTITPTTSPDHGFGDVGEVPGPVTVAGELGA